MSSVNTPFSPRASTSSAGNHHLYTTPTSPTAPKSARANAEYIDADDAWSGEDSGPEDGETSRKRKRPMSISCEICKHRKVKCDRGQPRCGWCVKNGQPCEYRERKKPGLRAGYGRELEARLDRLEGVLQSHQVAIERLAGGHGDSKGTNGGSEQRQFDYNTTRPPSERASREQSLHNLSRISDERVRHAEHSGNLQSSDRYLYNGREPQMHPASARGSMVYEQESAMRTASAPLLQLNDRPLVPLSQEEDLPPYDLLYAMVELYFRHVNTWCPILHRQSTFDTLFITPSLEEADRMLLHAIVATTMRFSTDHRLTPAKREFYYATSKQKVLLYGMENSSVKALQALVILATDIIGIANGPPAWNLMALIARSVVHLGLSVEATSKIIAPASPSIYLLRSVTLSEPGSWIEDESRRRLFWMVYVLDRSTTIPSALDFTLDESDIDRRLPCRDDLFTRNERVQTKWFGQGDRGTKDYRSGDLGSFSYYVEVLGIMSRTHRFLRMPVDISKADDVQRWQDEYREVDSIINAWRAGLPPEYSSTSRLSSTGSSNEDVSCGWILLQITYNLTVLRLHSAAAYPTHRSKYFAPSYNAGQRCLAAVDEISSLCAYVKSNSMLNKLGPPFAFAIWVAARLLLVHSSTIDHQVNPKINFFVSILRDLGEYWNVAQRYATLLQRVLDEYAEFEASAAHIGSGERSTPSSMKILADMRRTAFDLDFLMSRQPRQNALRASPSPGDLDLLDVFDFFMMPRLPNPNDTPVAAADGGLAPPSATAGLTYSGLENGVNNHEFNITNFTVDMNSDWYFNNPQE